MRSLAAWVFSVAVLGPGCDKEAAKPAGDPGPPAAPTAEASASSRPEPAPEPPRAPTVTLDDHELLIDGVSFVGSASDWKARAVAALVDRRLVAGVASYGLELFRAVPDLDTVYVPIGLGSGVCATMAARDALGLKTKVVGVVAERAPAYALSFAARKPVSTNSADTIADGVACRVPDPDALGLILKGADRIVTVSEEEIRAAMRHLFTDTHNLAEGAGAAALAGLLQEKTRMNGKRVAVIQTGGNIDRELYLSVLAG